MLKRERPIDINEPLELNLRLDDSTCALGRGDIVRVGLFIHHKPFLTELLDYLGARFRYLHSDELAGYRQKLAVLVDNLLFVEAVPLGNVEVSRIVPRGNGHRARAELTVYCGVLHDRSRDGAVYPLELEFLAVCVISVARVLRMHDDILIAELRLRACRANGERAILQVVESCLLFLIHNLVIADSGLAPRVPVDDTRAAVDKAGLVHALECFDNGA